jgi:methylthioribose-1-phosphate isomerase
MAGVPTTPAGVGGFNPAFDVTPHDLIGAVVTERGVAETATTPIRICSRPSRAEARVGSHRQGLVAR